MLQQCRRKPLCCACALQPSWVHNELKQCHMGMRHRVQTLLADVPSCKHGCRCSGRAAEMQPFGTVYDPAWDLRAYSGWSPSMGAIIVAFRWAALTIAVVACLLDLQACRQSGIACAL